jgi:hypothetical protein
MSLAVSGHNATIYVELGTPPVSGTFTLIPELRGDLPGLSGSRDETNTTPHGEDIDSWVTGPIVRAPLTFNLNYVPGDATHTALRAAWLATTVVNRRRGWRFWGPSGSAGVDEVIASGEITNWVDTSPEGAGVRTASITVRLSKQCKVDGVLYGTAA